MDFPFLPPQASTFANEMDKLYLLLWSLTIAFCILVAIMVTTFAIRYRRGTKVDRSKPVHQHHGLELTWSIIPLLLGLGVFVWAAKLYATVYSAPPPNAMEVFCVGKQWMWHFQHANGVRENNELHVPAGQPVKITAISQDVIHSFFVPAFRVKRDVVPGRYNQCWFTPTLPGKYHLFCAEYCGTQHSLMGGWVYVMKPEDFQTWLAKGGPRTVPVNQTMEQAGAQLYQDLACDNCHGAQSSERGPSLYGLYGKQVKMAKGESVKADESFLRDKILNPYANLTAGYGPTMPAYKGQMNEEQILQLIAYIKSLGTPNAPPGEQKPAGKPNKTSGSPAAGKPTIAPGSAVAAPSNSVTNRPAGSPREAQGANQGTQP